MEYQMAKYMQMQWWIFHSCPLLGRVNTAIVSIVHLWRSAMRHCRLPSVRHIQLDDRPTNETERCYGSGCNTRTWMSG